MKEGAIAILTATPEYCAAAVADGRYGVPAGATVEARIELLSFENIPETWEMSADQRLQVAPSHCLSLLPCLVLSCLVSLSVSVCLAVCLPLCLSLLFCFFMPCCRLRSICFSTS
eukprot:COSAG05_NODE_604_length_8399_cov_6.936145_7_plen_115_part_00